MKLKPCPWCGKKPKKYKMNNMVSILCKSWALECNVRPSTDWCLDPKMAENLWNNRTGEKQ